MSAFLLTKAAAITLQLKWNPGNQQKLLIDKERTQGISPDSCWIIGKKKKSKSFELPAGTMTIFPRGKYSLLLRYFLSHQTSMTNKHWHFNAINWVTEMTYNVIHPTKHHTLSKTTLMSMFPHYYSLSLSGLVSYQSKLHCLNLWMSLRTFTLFKECFDSLKKYYLAPGHCHHWHSVWVCCFHNLIWR